MMTMSVQDYRQIAYFNLQFLPEKKCFNYFKHGGAKMIWLDVSYTIVDWQDWRSLESVEKKRVGRRRRRRRRETPLLSNPHLWASYLIFKIAAIKAVKPKRPWFQPFHDLLYNSSTSLTVKVKAKQNDNWIRNNRGELSESILLWDLIVGYECPLTFNKC